MSFDERYRLLELAGDDDAKTFAAQEISTGKKVTVFLFVGEQARTQFELLIQLRSVDRAQLPELIETGENRGTPYVVTEPIDSLSELKSRLSRVKVAPQEAPENKTGEFAKAGVWHVPADLQSSRGGARKPSEDAVASDMHPTAKTTAHNANGSFTQMFQTAAAPIGEPAPDVPKAPAPPVAPPPPPSAPGSFTQIFQAAAAPIGESASEEPIPPVTQAQPKPAQSGPGEFTRFFSTASPSFPAPTPVPQKPESQGEFSRIFGNSDSATAPPATVTGIFGQSSSAPALKQGDSYSAPAPPPSFAQPAGQFTKIFGDTAMENPSPGRLAAPMPAPGAAPPASSPGEYTRMFSAQSLPTESPAEPVPVPFGASEPPSAAKRPSKMIPVLIGVTLLLLAAIAVLVITMRK